MLKVMPPDVNPWDPDRIIGPMTGHFADAMQGRFAGNEVLESTVWVFCEITDTDNGQIASEWLYTEKPKCEPCSCCDKLPKALYIEVL